MRTRGILQRLVSLVRPAQRSAPPTRAADDSPGRSGTTATIPLAPPAPGALRIGYAPDRDGGPDAGEVVWTWVPYAEGDGRGKDRPVLVIGRQSTDRVYAVRLTSTPHDGDPDFVSIGAGEWDSKERPSWADIRQVYSVHVRGMRREAAAPDRATFGRVAEQLRRRYGWKVAA
ncbi:type II toxin-antitoxin system PemK/MazF family toxin [Microbacterium jiangjiandongii]|uniref:type II toxin-antitoxin system PemK/MazF family toxin n=1 Tax=Microbacterium jiangjiandongii TaxID=3049071 RepID=UPI00214CFE6A|nr:type II toxin-antitoxin system PemK/MazF family toxin [Microbacterium sp. zg.Y843]MCR2814614.1 type II toxin-antitoxin system PemK/MazF family toxin [Microbacterium sp. zg.Y843]